MRKTGEDLLDDIVASEFAESSTVKYHTFDGNVVINTIEPANLQAFLATQFKDFSVGHRRYNTFKPLIGHSIFSADGAFWEHSRALFRPQFSRENINDLDMTDRASTALITALGDVSTQTGWTEGREMMPLLYNFTLDTATDFLFGQSVESQSLAIAAQKHDAGATQEFDPYTRNKMAEAKKFRDSFAIVNIMIISRIRAQSFWWLADGLEFRKAIRTIRNFTEHFVQLAVDRATSQSKVESGKKESLLNNLATQTQDRTELRDQTLSILLAGRDTTAALLGWSLARLAIHPEVFAKLRSTVLRELPQNEEITFAKLKGCRYLQHFLNEVLRLHPLVPINQRIAVKDTTLPTGGGPDKCSPIAVRKGQSVLFSVYLMQRRKDLWGADALEFKPERWEQRWPAWQYLPFLGGPRICVGQQFALTEASYALVRLLREFDAIEPVDWEEARMLKKNLGVTLRPGEGEKIRFRKAGVVA